ncbi:hypothetical protein KY345_03410 [Candidatus Woesearchaeota archaeon]|nr:hypothetical protein [Candidatus Woesearchaeota archaeon]
MSYSSCFGYSSGGGCSYSPSFSGYSSQSGYSSPQTSSYSSNLEYTISHSEIETPKEINFNPVETNYRQKKYFESYLNNSKLNQTYTNNSPFLLQNTETRFIGDIADISDHIEEAFRKTTGEQFPDDILIHVCSKEKLREFHSEFGGIWSDGINGFSINRKKSGLKSEIFVCQGQLSNVIATLGHEIGHCISVPLETPRDEEAKAFAFEFAWVKAINKENIANLRGCFNISNPAKNNIHDIAFSFVHDLIKDGAEAIKLCFKLISKEISVGYFE